MIKMIRVDYRLLHGQVAVSWTSMLGADCLLLVSDTVLDDPLRLSSLKLAKPEGAKVVIKNLKDSIEALKSGITDKYKLFIVCENIQLAKQIAEAMDVKEINLGNTPYREDARQASKSIFLDAQDEEDVRQMVSNGMDIFIQMVPSERKINAQSILK